MATGERVKLKPTKLNGENYRTWAYQMKLLFEYEGVAAVLTTNRPPESDAGERTTWDKACDRVKVLIAFNVEDNQTIYIKNATNGKLSWEALKEMYDQRDVGAQVRVLKRLLKMNFSFGDQMREHLAKMMDFLDQLGEMDAPMTETMKVGVILASLSSEYEAIVTAIEAWESARITVANVRQKLIEEWEKKQKTNLLGKAATKGAVDSEYSTASRTEKEGRTGEQDYGRRARGRFNCYGCGQEGHIKRNCPDLRETLKRIRSHNVESNEDENKNMSAKTARSGHWYKCLSLRTHDLSSGWIIDSGATEHMCNAQEMFKRIDRSQRGRVRVANGELIDAVGKGEIDILLDLKHEKMNVTLNDALLIPELDCNLVSVSKLTDRGFTVEFRGKNCYLRDGNEVLEIGSRENGTYRVHEAARCFQATMSTSERCVHEWHKVLSHRNLSDIRRMKSEGLRIADCKCTDVCESCIKGKMARKPFPKKATPTNEVMDCVVSDVCGPIQTETVGKKRYFVTFIDVHSGYTVVKLLRERSEVPNLAVEYIEHMKTQLGKKPKVFRSDRGTEYMGAKLQEYLRKEGIKFQCTVGYAPEQNGIAERMNRTLMEAVRTMMIDAGLPKSLWGEAIFTACYTLNCVLKANQKKSPYEVVFKKKPAFAEFHEFGGDVFVKVPDEKRRKLDDKAIKMKFVGYDESSKGYRLVDRNWRVKISREVRFLNSKQVWNNEEASQEQDKNEPSELFVYLRPYEEEFHREEVVDIFYDAEDNENDEHVQEEMIVDEQQLEEHVQNDEFQEELVNDEVQEEQMPRRSTRENAGRQPARYDDYVMLTVNSESEMFEPRTYKQATGCRYAKDWHDAMKEELDSIHENETWELVELPQGRKAIGSKWVFKIKVDENGKITRRKARLVAQGFSQQYGVDYDEVFAPVVRNATFRLLLSDAGVQGYKVKQYDIKSAFLNGNLTEEIYMKQPMGFQTGDKVYRLRKSLYGLKQAARVWNQTLHDELVRNGCCQSKTDKCLYFLERNSGVVKLLVHVDDMLVAYNDESLMKNLMRNVGEAFEMKDLGQVKHFLEIDVTRNNEGHYEISQSRYIDKILKETGLTDAKESKYPLDLGYWKLDPEENKLQSNEEYRKIIGMLLYLATNTRPDISAAVSILSQKVTCPTQTDLNEAKRIVKYLKGTRDLRLKMSSEDCKEKLFAHSDANWAEDRRDRKSNSGYLCKINGGTVSWSCRKQDLVTMSTTEAEYVALSETCKEMSWLKRISKEMKINVPAVTTIFTDSQSAMNMINNQKFSNRTKHIDIKYHFVKDQVMTGEVKLEYVSTDKNIADMLTKPLGATKIAQLREAAGLIKVPRGAAKDAPHTPKLPIEEEC